MITLRPITIEDSDLLRHWRNDPATLHASFTKRKVDSIQHGAWLIKMLSNPVNALFMGLIDDQPVGSVRFYRSQQYEAEISVVVAPHTRGKGVGPALIQAGCQAIREKWNVSTILARIDPGNRRSIRAFEKAGFQSYQLLMCSP